jgi:predicted mannosyl-3-phosphoglycerate phosphatase (HAD superfamily)
MGLTGLNEQQAEASQKRLFSDPIIWLDRDDKQYEFIKIITDLGFNVIKGGRFLTICSHHDKSNALKWIKNAYEKQHKTSFFTIGLGDGENDIKMIEASDIKILIKNNNDHLKQANWIFSKQTGPKGWNDELLKVLKNE